MRQVMDMQTGLAYLQMSEFSSA
nr:MULTISPECIES: hypothetical protein [unclassified Mesorhizobium]